VTPGELLAGGSGAAVHRFTPESNLNERLASDVLAYSTPDLLRYEDKNSMAFSIEARVPFLDHEMVEYIFSLPIDQKIKGGWNRAVYRNAMKGRMPEKNRRRRSKVGFTNPDISWMKAKASDIRSIFGQRETAARGIYDRAQLVRAWDEYLAGRPGDGLIFWRVLVTELWMRRYIDGPMSL
jgi:asparagine synthase (glutamine-hydrolysing)